MSKFKNSIGIGRQPGMYSFLQRIPVRDSLESTGDSAEMGFKKSHMHHIVQLGNRDSLESRTDFKDYKT